VKDANMFTEIRTRNRRRRQRENISRLIATVGGRQRDDLIVMAQRQGLL
jgi:hypothetical protein